MCVCMCVCVCVCVYVCVYVCVCARKHRLEGLNAAPVHRGGTGAGADEVEQVIDLVCLYDRFSLSVSL